MPTAPDVAAHPPKVAVAGYARAAGVCSLIAAILAVVVPIVGVLWFSPLAVILGIIAMKGGARGYGIAVLVIVTVNMVISPTFWLNIGAGSTMPGAGANRMVTYINVFGVLGMILMLFTGRLWTTVAAVVIGLIGVGIYGQISKPWINPPDRTAAAPVTEPRPSRGEVPNRQALNGPSNTRSGQICESPPTNAVTFRADRGRSQDTFYGSVYVREGAPSSPTLSFGGWGDYYRDFIQFDLTAAPEGQPPSAFAHAYLCLYLVDHPARDPVLETTAIASDWSAEQVNYGRSPTVYMSDSVSFGPVHDGWNVVEITSFAIPWLNGGKANHGLQIWADDMDHTNGSFASSKAGDQSKRPRLVVTP